MLKDESVAHIFKVFARLYNHKFNQAAGDKFALTVWKQSLKHARITDAEVRVGLRNCVNLEWPPSVGEFIKACRLDPESLNLPSMIEAKREIYRAAATPGQWAEFPWSHPALYYVARELSLDQLRSKDSSKLIEHFYTMVIRRVAAGEEMDLPIQRAIEHKAGPRTPEGLRAGIEACRQALKGEAS